MTDTLKKEEESLQESYNLIPEKITLHLSGEQALAVLLCLGSFAKQGLELGVVSESDWVEREKLIKIFLDATNCHVRCPKTFVKNLDEIIQDIASVKL
ncbi:hypothetical protein [Floridanema aerugineum]|uniref:LAGLIDADG homing endonuclease n=1 Tax=Floridaenema aerugineum BLCC-F46 TaxID=3153654 RepID=A0ABV4XDL0_9CYAN